MAKRLLRQTAITQIPSGVSSAIPPLAARRHTTPSQSLGRHLDTIGVGFPLEPGDPKWLALSSLHLGQSYRYLRLLPPGKTSKRYEERFIGCSVIESPPCVKTPLKQRDCKTT